MRRYENEIKLTKGFANRQLLIAKTLQPRC
jgi:hypothetical protein